jgi:NAD/NADP transhydrogenase beta subunit
MGWMAKSALLAIIGGFWIGPTPTLFAQDSATAWKNCRSSDAEKRLLGCTEIINAKGYGSAVRLADALSCTQLKER